MTIRPTGYRRLLLPATFVAAAVFLLAVARAVAQEPTVYVEMSSEEIAADGEPVAVSVVVEDVTNLGAFQFSLSYDPAVLTLLDIEEGPFLGSSGREVACLPPRMAEGLVDLTCPTLGAKPDGPDGAGELATLLFQPVAAGTSPLQFQRLLLTDPPAQRIQAQTRDACLSLDPAGDGAFAATLWLPATDTVADGEDLCVKPGGDGGFAWAIWGPVIGIGVLALAAVTVSAVWWSRRPRRA